MRITLTTAICGVGDVGHTLDDARGAEWIGRGLAVAASAASVASEPAEAVEAVEAAEPVADVASSRVPDFFAPEPPMQHEPRRKRR